MLVMALALAACGRSETYRYKLTLAVHTPEGVKRGRSIAEVLFFDVSIPERGTMHRLRGEALYLDLGAGRRPLIALLTSQLRPKYGKDLRWSRDGGPIFSFLTRLYGETPSSDFMDDVARIARKRGPRAISPNDLPDLVTFEDVNDPNTVRTVDPNDLQATLGPNVTWNEITLESTDEPVTKEIALKLPWIPYYWCGMLDGERYSNGRTVANTLSTADFDWSDEQRQIIQRKLSGNSNEECNKSHAEWQQQRHR